MRLTAALTPSKEAQDEKERISWRMEMKDGLLLNFDRTAQANPSDEAEKK